VIAGQALADGLASLLMQRLDDAEARLKQSAGN